MTLKRSLYFSFPKKGSSSNSGRTVFIEENFMTKIYPVIMSGGAGTRLWPVSRNKTPKQYHAMVAENTMFAETLLRMRDSGNNDVAAPIIICARGHETLIQAQADQLDISLTGIILEPMGRNTAAVGAIAAEFVHRLDPDGLILLLPADHHIEEPEEFWFAIEKATAVATSGYLMTLGIEPTGPDTGFGYIHRGEKIADDVFKIQAFKEKPNEFTATTYLKTGEYSWNAGIFLFDVKRLMKDYAEHAEDIFNDSIKALDHAKTEGICHFLSETHFAECRSEPIDIAIMEKTAYAAVVAPVRAGWNDIGSWAAISDFLVARSTRESASIGDVRMVDTNNCYVRSDGPFIATIGVEDLIVVATGDAVLVTHKSSTQDVKKIVTFLREEERTDLL